MSIEAELKARVSDVGHVRNALAERADKQSATYRDTYYDGPGRPLTARGEELRLRTVETSHGTRHLLTYKAPDIDGHHGSKPEFETAVADREAADGIVVGLGHEPVISFTKNCENYRFIASGLEMLATLVTVPELDGTYLEVETLVEAEADVASALDAVRAVLHQLGILDTDLTDELYTDAVARAQTTATPA